MKFSQRYITGMIVVLCNSRITLQFETTPKVIWDLLANSQGVMKHRMQIQQN